MLDDSDVDFALLSGIGATGAFGVVIIIIAIIISIIVYDNKEDCSKKKCEHGTPQLVNHDCYCIEKAK
mgnify:CR=1 FL=1